MMQYLWLFVYIYESDGIVTITDSAIYRYKKDAKNRFIEERRRVLEELLYPKAEIVNREENDSFFHLALKKNHQFTIYFMKKPVIETT